MKTAAKPIDRRSMAQIKAERTALMRQLNGLIFGGRRFRQIDRRLTEIDNEIAGKKAGG